MRALASGEDYVGVRNRQEGGAEDGSKDLLVTSAPSTVQSGLSYSKTISIHIQLWHLDIVIVPGVIYRGTYL